MDGLIFQLSYCQMSLVAKRIFNFIYCAYQDFLYLATECRQLWTQWHSVLFVQIENELRGICNDVLAVLKDHLLPVATQAEAKVFYSKMYVSLALYMSLFVSCYIMHYIVVINWYILFLANHS